MVCIKFKSTLPGGCMKELSFRLHFESCIMTSSICNAYKLSERSVRLHSCIMQMVPNLPVSKITGSCHVIIF